MLVKPRVRCPVVYLQPHHRRYNRQSNLQQRRQPSIHSPWPKFVRYLSINFPYFINYYYSKILYILRSITSAGCCSFSMFFFCSFKKIISNFRQTIKSFLGVHGQQQQQQLHIITTAVVVVVVDNSIEPISTRAIIDPQQQRYYGFIERVSFYRGLYNNIEKCAIRKGRPLL